MASDFKCEFDGTDDYCPYYKVSSWFDVQG
jgi:hypothetical protein